MTQHGKAEKTDTADGEHLFRTPARPLLERKGVTRFFAGSNRRTGDLLVKLPEARVDEALAFVGGQS